MSPLILLLLTCAFVQGTERPLFLTSYINSGNISQGQRLSEVKGLPVDVASYSGFLNVNPEYNSNLFFWFFPSEKEPQNVPVVLWLLGGPGSSLHSLFTENGPFEMDQNGNLQRRTFTWTSACNMLYIEAPVGAGFSFTTHDKGFSTKQADVGYDLYQALLQFFALFPEYLDNDFYVMGESYAGKYASAVSYLIHQENSNANGTINFKGMAIGSGWVDPLRMMDYGSYLYNMGLLDENEAKNFQDMESQIKDYISRKKWLEALSIFDKLLENYGQLTGFETYDSYLYPKPKRNNSYNESFLQSPKVRAAIHVGNIPFNDTTVVDKNLQADIMQSVKPLIEELLDNDYKVLLYSGQTDVIAAHTLTQNFIKNLNWRGAGNYNKTKKVIWRVDDEIAGYVKQAGNFTYIIVRNAGHLVPQDQPRWAYDMISRFLTEKSF